MNKEKEIETVTLMVRRYCWGVHGTRARRLADTPYRSFSELPEVSRVCRI